MAVGDGDMGCCPLAVVVGGDTIVVNKRGSYRKATIGQDNLMGIAVLSYVLSCGLPHKNHISILLEIIHEGLCSRKGATPDNGK